MDLLVIGDCSVDQYMDIEDSAVLNDPSTQEQRICFLHGSKIVVDKFYANLAGNSCHVGVGAARLGLKVGIYTELGDDDYGDKFIKTFKTEGIDTKLCRQAKNTNTNVHTIILHAGERTIFSYHEPRKYHLDFEHLKGAEKPKWIYYTSLAHGYEEFQNNLVKYIKASDDIGVAYNPGSIQLTNLNKVKEFLQIVDVLFVNKEEAKKILEIKDDVEGRLLHEGLHKLGAKLTVITDGAKGASAYDGSKVVVKPALTVDKIVNKTGAGDTYATTFVSALNYGKTLEVAMDWSAKNSANVVKGTGALAGMLGKSEVEKP